MSMVVFQDTRRRQVFDIDPDAVKVFMIDWAHRLACNPTNPADTLATSTFSADPPVNVVSSSNTPTASMLKLSVPGVAGREYPVRNRVTTTAGETDDWTIYFRPRES